MRFWNWNIDIKNRWLFFMWCFMEFSYSFWRYKFWFLFNFFFIGLKVFFFFLILNFLFILSFLLLLFFNLITNLLGALFFFCANLLFHETKVPSGLFLHLFKSFFFIFLRLKNFLNPFFSLSIEFPYFQNFRFKSSL